MRMSVDELFEQLRRYPDVEAPNLFAVDAADRLILDVAAADLRAAAPGEVAVIGDSYGALTLGAATAFGVTGLRVHQDPRTAELALEHNAHAAGLHTMYRNCKLGGDLLGGARVVLLQLPRSLAELTEIAETVASHAAPDVRIYAGGRDKHLTLAMNDVLGMSFAHVQATRGRQKARVLVCLEPRPPAQLSFPVVEDHPELGVTVVAHGGVFSGARLDIGTRFLLDFLPRMRTGDAVDLGCGTGVLAVALARRGHRVIATDNSASAVASAAKTLIANNVVAPTIRDDAMTGFDADSADLIVCNPPFHIGAAVHTGAAVKLFREAGRVLRSTGELWTVHNSHLNYRGVLDRLVGPTDVVGRNRKFTVTRSVRMPERG